jgi:phage protein D
VEKGDADIMANTDSARRVELRLSFKNMTMPDDLNTHLVSASYTDAEEDYTDDFQITYDDRENNLLGSWIEVKPTVNKSGMDISKSVAPTQVINYVVKRGDTLSKIALEYLGSAKKYPQIAQENNIKNPNLIYPGQVFRITTGGQVSTTTTQAPAQKIEPKLISASIVQKNWNDTGKDVTLSCGTFEIDSVDVSGPPHTVAIKSTSIPYTSTLRMEKKSRAWEKITLKEIGTQIAQESNMNLMYEADYNPLYERKEQIQTSDIVFLQKLCKAAGMALKVTELTVIIYDAAVYDNKPEVKTLTRGSADIISYRLGTSLTDTAYTSCHVSWTDAETQETIEYTYTPDSSTGTGQTLEINERVTSTAEAVELAKKRLREKNTQEHTASFTIVGDVSIVAGVTVRLSGFQEFDRKYKVTEAKHKLTGGYTVDISLKQVLEGY